MLYIYFYEPYLEKEVLLNYIKHIWNHKYIKQLNDVAEYILPAKYFFDNNHSYQKANIFLEIHDKGFMNVITNLSLLATDQIMGVVHCIEIALLFNTNGVL